MSKDDCKHRFKGVENFLRRVAFNLGNTPSQTEVKVISCIPIDVSDLQQKIIELEKQLEAANGKVIGTSQIRINAALCNTSFPRITNVANSSKSISCHHPSAVLNCPKLSINNSKNSIVCPPGPCMARDYFFSTDASEMTYSKNLKQEGRKKFFNKKMTSKKKKMRTQFVYRAQTEDRNPFNQHGLPDDGTNKNRGNEDSNAFERSYLSDMVRKQYKPSAVNVDFDMSEFSTPICRDFIRTQKLLNLQSHESDMCSCCHGPFRNIDNHMSKHNNCDIFSSQTESNNIYYDSKFYDVIPVKEESVKIKNTQLLKKKEPKQLTKNNTDIAWPGYVRPSGRARPPIIVNYNTTGPPRQHITKVPVKSHNTREKVLNKMYRKPATSVHINRQMKTNVSKIRSVEVSEVYTRRLNKNRRKIVPKPTPTRVAKQRNDVGCLTAIVANTECQTTSGNNHILQENKNAEVTNVTANQSDDKTKVTLNQIKEILQSVLIEVKTNSKIGNIPGQAKKKDAVVQNDLLKSNHFGGSSLLQTFTYGPYDIDPYGPSCSQQLQTSSLCYPNMPPGSAKCMQHYPLFVQPGRNMCASCYNPNRSNPINKLPNIKRAASTAINTEELRARSKETENLIREIYRAMALNIDINTEDTPTKEHGDRNETIQNNTRTENKESNHLANAISQIFTNTNPIETSATQNTSTPFDSKLALNENSFRSHPGKRNAGAESGKYYNNTLCNNNTHQNEQVSRQIESAEKSDTTIVNEETESSASETESEYDEGDVLLAIEEPVKKKEKKGLFCKMLKIFTPRSRNTKTSNVVNQPTDRDSVDYRIVHGNKTVAPKSALQPTTSRSRAVIYYSKKPQKYRNQSPVLPRKAPYMEQKYKRYSDEKLMFHDAQDPKSSAQGMPQKNKPVYYQQIETRSALIDQYHQKENRQNEIETRSMKQFLNRGIQQLEHNSHTKSASPERVSIVPAKALHWMEKHKVGIHCGKQWKKLILES